MGLRKRNMANIWRRTCTTWWNAINTFVYQATRILFGQLNRRSQRKSFTWEQFERFRKAHPLPPVKLGCALY